MVESLPWLSVEKCEIGANSLNNFNYMQYTLGRYLAKRAETSTFVFLQR